MRARDYAGDPEFEFYMLALEAGERIVERQAELGLTDAMVASRMGSRTERFRRILRGNDGLTLKSIVAVAAALDCRVQLTLLPNPPSCGDGVDML